MFTGKLGQSISFRFQVIVGCILIVSTIIVSTMIATNERKMLRNSLMVKGQSFGSYVAHLGQDPLVMKDSIQLDALVNEANRDEDIMYAVIHDAKGNIVTSQYASINYRSPRLKPILSGLPRESEIQDIVAAVRNKEAVAELSVPILSGAVPVGKVTIGMSENKLRRQIETTMLFVVALNLVVAIALGAVLFFATKKIILDPISELAHATASLAEGDSGIQVKARATGEVGMLVDSFNRMAEELGKRRKELIKAQGELVLNLKAKREIEKRQAKEQIDFLASHDPLTNLPNRTLLADRIQQALFQAKRRRLQTGVLFIDLDNFKVVNDSLGHDNGDKLLKVVAERLTESVRSVDTVARVGGDDFVIVAELAESEDVAKVTRKIQEAVGRPFQIDEHELEISCSIGISIFPKDGEDVGTLLKNADAAMFRAKELGRGNFQFYTSEMNDRVVARLTMEKHLRRALERGELLLHYQPQVDLGTGSIAGIEALLRWQNPELGMISPGSFISLAEDTGLIVPIGEWVIREACARNKAWQDAGLTPLVMAVNISPRQFRHAQLPETLERILRETGLEPRYLELEVTESMVMHDAEVAGAILAKMKKLEVRLTMDDFGTGYSSLGYLKRFPFDKLKIDISFVRDITTNPESAEICKAIIALAHTLGLDVIAEGVETEGQLEHLRSHACDEIQGFYFSRPVPAAEMEQLLREDRRLRFPEEGLAHPERTLLLVDDEPMVLASMEEVLSEEGCRILSATSADQGFELMAVNRVGVVLCDLRMPVMNGTDFLSRVKEMYPGTIRIAMSAYADMETVIDAVNKGDIYKFLTKPWEVNLLRQSIRDAFRSCESDRGKSES
ncbi:MAG: EAL domain-containing protein [Geobacter sp.]|nr:EAL domain-containing protein [Geobacter sp.]